MKVTDTNLVGAVVFEPKVFGDDRGYFKETWHDGRYHEFGLPLQFVQDNVSRSGRGILRGLHIQNPQPQGKLVQVLEGEVFDVAVDIRFGSPTFGKWHGANLSAENHKQFYIPPGMAHGFQVISESALFCYKCTDYYAPENEFTLAWDDPEIGISWPLGEPKLSEKDQKGLRLSELNETMLMPFQG